LGERYKAKRSNAGDLKEEYEETEEEIVAEAETEENEIVEETSRW
jgi:hypothetical protein